MVKASLWVTCVGLAWSATASAVPVYYTYGYFGEGRSEANGDAPTWRFTMEYDLDRQATYLDRNGNLTTQQDLGYHGDPNGPWYGYYQLDFFHARLVGTTEQLDIDWTAPNRYTSFRQIAGDEAPAPLRYEDVVRWGTGNFFIQLVRDPGIIGAPLGSYFPFIADIDLGPTMACNGPCGPNLHLLNVSSTNSVPEPATLGLLALGVGLAAGVKRRRTKQLGAQG